MRSIAVFACLLAIACEPPPEVVLAGAGETGLDDPSIEILHPQNGDTFDLGPDCALTEWLVVHVANFELSEDQINEDPVEGVGHWHGGPDLAGGNYCLSAEERCVGADGGGLGTYDGTILSPSLITIQVELQSNDHQPLGVTDQVEVTLTDIAGACP